MQWNTLKFVSQDAHPSATYQTAWKQVFKLYVVWKLYSQPSRGLSCSLLGEQCTQHVKIWPKIQNYFGHIELSRNHDMHLPFSFMRGRASWEACFKSRNDRNNEHQSQKKRPVTVNWTHESLIKVCPGRNENGYMTRTQHCQHCRRNGSTKWIVTSNKLSDARVAPPEGTRSATACRWPSSWQRSQWCTWCVAYPLGATWWTTPQTTPQSANSPPHAVHKFKEWWGSSMQTWIYTC